MNNSTIQDEINLKEILNFLLRNKKNIIKSALLAFFLSTLFALNQKKIWQGEFQIVLQQDQKSRLSNFNFDQFSSILGSSSSKEKSLDTEIGILKSPSILMEIYEYVKEKKISQDPNNKNFISFQDWKDSNLKIKLEPKTTILSLSYRDKDKKIILPVLKKISSSYQDYSGRKRSRNIELGIQFYRSQIDIFKNKSEESFKDYQAFAIKQDLIEVNDQTRTIAANEIRLIEEKLKSIESIGENSQVLKYLDELDKEVPLRQEINDIEKKLFFAKKIYKSSSKEIEDILAEKEYLYDSLFNQLKGVLLAKKSNANAKLNASKRPEDTLIKYKQLFNNLEKDEKTLSELEKGYRAILLEKARNEDPWQLITTPTLLPNAVAPKKKNIVVIFTFIGLIVGSTISALLEKKNDYIFSIKEFKSLCNYPIIGEFLFDKDETLEESIQFLIDTQFSGFGKDIEIISIGNLEESLLLKIKDYFDTNCNNKIIKKSQKLKDFSTNTKYIFISKLGLTKRGDLENLNRKIQNLNLNLGMIILG